MNETNKIWKDKLRKTLDNPDYVVSPRGMEVREEINGSYAVPMPAYISLVERKVNEPFMFAEAAWIISGSNRLDEITPFMKGYANFSDDGVFMRGAYGPKVVDQLGYVTDSLEKDLDTRQAVMTIWRERPGPSKDIPCTVAMQFLVRDNKLNAITTMRSQDIVLGFTYDVFTFSMIAKSVQLLLNERGHRVGLGTLFVNAGSLHLYEKHYNDAKRWLDNGKTDPYLETEVSLLDQVETYPELIKELRRMSTATKELLP